MAVNDWLARRAVRGVAVLLVEVPGAWAVRVAVEREVVARGWRTATSPADADALVVCGAPGEPWRPVLARTWEQVPGPRARAQVRSAGEVGATLDDVARSLLDDAAQRADAAARPVVPEDVTEGGDMDPAGLPLAGGEDDVRDGLEMDVLTVPLGPVLPCWPAGLVLRTTLSGDVVVRAQVEVLPGSQAPGGGGAGGGHGDAGGRGADDRRVDAARRADAAAQVLLLAGADDLAAAAVSVRDAYLATDPAPLAGASAERERLRRRAERSRVLRWMLPGDVRDRLLALLADEPPAPGGLDDLPERLAGLELVTARLVVASLDLRTERLASAPEVGRG